MTTEKTWAQGVPIEKLVAFLKSLPKHTPVTGKKSDLPLVSHDPAWNQTEEEYQAEQARWLADREAKKRQKRQLHL